MWTRVHAARKAAHHSVLAKPGPLFPSPSGGRVHYLFAFPISRLLLGEMSPRWPYSGQEEEAGLRCGQVLRWEFSEMALRRWRPILLGGEEGVLQGVGR